MATIDLALTIIFGFLSLLGLTGAALSFRMALKVAGERDGDLKMAFWTLGVLAGLIVAGMSGAYFLIPIFMHY
jgi:hypothetical protein